MPWIRARLRGTTVFARADASGALSPIAGRVEIRYKPNDGKLYRANASNLTIVDPTPLPDETCGEAKEPEKDHAAGRSSVKGGRAPGSAEVLTPDGCWEAWTDGACSGNPGPAGLGIVLFDDEHRTEISEYLGHATNNVAELTAVLRALQAIPRTQPAVIRTDSQYSIGVLQKGWKAKANAQLVASIKRELAGRPSTRLVYTPGHAGVSFNERADQLARMAVSTRSSSTRSYPRQQV